MKTDWKISKSKFVCSQETCGKTLAENENYFGALVDGANGLERRDYCDACWENARNGVYTFWKTQVPVKSNAQKVINYDLLANLFQRLVEDKEDEKQKFCFIIALLLMRKKILRFEDTFEENGRKFMLLKESGQAKIHTVFDPQLSDDELETVRGDLEKLLASDLSE